MVTAKKISQDPLFLSEAVNHTMTVVRRGLQIGMHLSSLYTKHSGLESLMHLNERGGLAGEHLTEFREKYRTAAAVALFTSAYYVLHEMINYRAEDVAGVELTFGGIPEVTFHSPVHAVNCMLYYYAAYLEKSGEVRSELDLLKMTVLFFQGIVDEVKQREGSFRHTDTFTSRHYKLKRGDFTVSGFDVNLNSGGASVTFNRVALENIVGNKDAKHKARRLAERLLCYDKDAKANPMQELGGLPHIRAGFGKPGTGKSMQIAATATLLSDRCADCTGLPFFFNPLPDNIISTFQGGSGERMVNWFKPFHDPNAIVYGPIDDGEQNLEDRTPAGSVRGRARGHLRLPAPHRRGLRRLAGKRGHRNLHQPAGSDRQGRAVADSGSFPHRRRRIHGRFPGPGLPVVVQAVPHGIDPSFVSTQSIDGYQWLSAQRKLGSMSECLAVNPDAPKKRKNYGRFFSRWSKPSSPTATAISRRFTKVCKKFLRTSARETSATSSARVDERILDVDFPDDWFDDPTLFYRKPYEEKKQMIIELMHQNMRGLSFGEIRRQEAVRYIDTMIRINQGGRERRITETMERIALEREALQRLGGQVSR